VKCDDVSRDNPCILELDDIKRLEGILKEFNFSSWKSVLDMAEGYGINSASITSYVRKADPAAGLSAVSGFMWGAVLALKAKAIDPVTVQSGSLEVLGILHCVIALLIDRALPKGMVSLFRYCSIPGYHPWQSSVVEFRMGSSDHIPSLSP